MVARRSSQVRGSFMIGFKLSAAAFTALVLASATPAMAAGLSTQEQKLVTVAGRDLGFPGKEGKPWHETFTYETNPTPAG